MVTSDVSVLTVDSSDLTVDCVVSACLRVLLVALALGLALELVLVLGREWPGWGGRGWYGGVAVGVVVGGVR